MTLPTGAIIATSNRDRYLVEGLLGKGGFGAIYLVRDLRVRQNLFAMKQIIDPNKRERERLTFEIEVLMRLDHPALPRVYRVFEDSKRNQTFLLMDYIEGTNLELLRRRQPHSRFFWQKVGEMMTPIMETVTFLHSQHPPIIHRDIKPANIIIPSMEERPVLVDFGIAKAYESEDTTTAVRHCSPGYSAPEQYGLGTTPRTDIYGLGATVYTLLTGEIPADALQRMVRLGNQEPDPLRPVNEIVPNVPLTMAVAVQRALSVNSNERFSSVEEFKEAMLSSESAVQQQFSEQSGVLPVRQLGVVLPEKMVGGTVTISLPEQKGGRLRKWRAFSLVLLVLLITLGIVTSRWIATESHSGAHGVPLPLTTPTATPKAIPTTSSHTSLYPPLSYRYVGTIDRLTPNAKMSMLLSNIQQEGESIQGYFTGLGLTGPCKGTVDTAGHIQLQVTIYAGNETLAFDGIVQLGGNLAGTFQVLNRDKQFTGEYGLWSVAPAASG